MTVKRDGRPRVGTTSRDTQHGPLVEWMDAELVDDRTAQITAHNLFTRTGDTVTIREARLADLQVDSLSDLSQHWGQSRN